MSWELAQTQLVRKLIASWLIILPILSPLSIGKNCTWGTRAWTIHCKGAILHGDCWAGVATVVEGGVLIAGHWWAALIMGGRLPGMLLCVQRECNGFVFFNRLGAVAFGAIIIAGTSVILVRSVTTLCSPECSLLPSTLCSTLCSGGGMYSWHCKLGGGGQPFVSRVS